VRRVVAGVAVLLAGVGCGSPGSEHSALLQAGIPLLLVSGEDGQPVTGASVHIAGQRFVSDANGRVDLGLAVDGDVDVEASRFLVRETALTSGRTLTLWPTGPEYPEHYVRHLLYKDAASTRNELSLSADAPLRRVMAATVHVVPDEALWADRSARSAHERAVALINEATGGRVRFELRSSARSGVMFRAYVDGTATAAGALTYRDLVRNEVVGGRIVYANLGAARSERFVAHELGHALGLQHSIRSSDLMYFSALQTAAAAFSDHERLSIRLLLQRPAGNRYPDNDRAVAGSSTSPTTSIVAD
jgi:hypothetical protein